jgi:isoamyl acetate esterase
LQVATAAGLPVVDLWTRLQAIENWPLLLSDGLHLSPAGNQAVFTEVKRVLMAELPLIAPELLPLDMPWHDRIQGPPAEVFACYLPSK